MTNKEIVNQFYQLISEGKTEDANKLLSPELKYWISAEGSWAFGGWQTKESMGEIFKTISERFPEGLTITVKSIIAEGDTVAVLVNNYAKRIDGKLYNNDILNLVKLENGLIVEQKEFLDTIHVSTLFCGDLEI